MEAVLESCNLSRLAEPLEEMGVRDLQELAMCEPSDITHDLNVETEDAKKLLQAVQDALLFEKRKTAIQSTWKVVGDALGVEATKLFYQRLFDQYPTVKPMFKDADMDSQAEKLLKTVSFAVEYLDDVEGLLPKLEELGKRHASDWNVQKEHYDAVGECLIWTLSTGLGDAWTPEVADAWTWVYGVIAKTMADGGESVVNEKRKSLVQGSWKAVGDTLNSAATKLFYKHLFEEYPETLPLFSNADMEEQSEKLFKTVSIAVDNLNDVEGLVPILQELGARHAVEWKIERKHYDMVGECLMWTLKTGLADAWNDELEDAWLWCYGLVATTMADAGEACCC